MQLKRWKCKGVIVDLGGKFSLQRPRGAFGDLVLDCDVRARLVQILRGETAVEMLGDQSAQRQERFALKRNGCAGPKVHNPGDRGLRRGKFARDAGEKVLQLFKQGWRKGVKQRDMRVQVIALCGVMRTAQAFCPALDFMRKRRGHDERARQA